MISKLAYVDPQAKLAEGVVVEPFAYIEGDVVIGAGSWIGPGAYIMNGTRMGKNNKVHPGAVISGIPQDLKFRGEQTTVEIGDNNTMREGVTINRGTAARGKTVLGDNNLLMTCAHVGHDCVVGNNCVLVNRVSLAGEVEVGDWAILGGHTAVHQFCRIGAHSMLSGGSLVSKDVPPYVKGGHLPVSFAGVNFLGLRRRGFDSKQVAIIQDIYRIIFQSGFGTSKAIETIEQQVEDCELRAEIVDFVRNSKRGILKPYNPAKEGDDMD